MSSLWFVVPVHGRAQLAQICLNQLRLTCDKLTDNGIEATAVVVGDDENLDTARNLGFATVRRDNKFLSRKFNDGIQLALDRRHNPRPADYVVPCGSDDWVDWRLFLVLPSGNMMLAFKQAAFVSEDGQSIVSRVLDYPGGVGIRVYPRQVMARCGYRPADEDRERACDTSILINVQKTFGNGGPRILYGDQHEFQIVDWKSPGEQLNGYQDVIGRHRRGGEPTDPFEALDSVFPAESLDAMRAHYGIRSGDCMTEYGVYLVTGKRQYRGHDPGTEFEAILDPGVERRAVTRGDIQLLRRMEPDLPEGSYLLPAGWTDEDEPPSAALSLRRRVVQ